MRGWRRMAKDEAGRQLTRVVARALEPGEQADLASAVIAGPDPLLILVCDAVMAAAIAGAAALGRGHVTGGVLLAGLAVAALAVRLTAWNRRVACLTDRRMMLLPLRAPKGSQAIAPVAEAPRSSLVVGRVRRRAVYSRLLVARSDGGPPFRLGFEGRWQAEAQAIQEALAQSSGPTASSTA